jgi:hypothetical protein
MLTLFSVPKPFEGGIGALQRRSIESWCALDVQVLLLGDAADTARELGVEHLAGVVVTSHGTPRLDSAFALADDAARFPLRCFVNADVILGPDLLTAVRAVSGQADRFLVVGQTEEDGKKRGAAAMDWFVFTPGLFGDIPPFAIGRACFDNWLVWKGRQAGIVVDATHDVYAVHQAHGYGHVDGGKDEAYYGEEAARNLELAGGKSHLYTLHDASHVLRGGKLRRNPGAPLRWREHVRKAAYKLGGLR